MKSTVRYGLFFFLLCGTIGVALGQTKMKVDQENSKVNWKGFKPTGDHNGTLDLQEGHFEVKNKEVQAGEFDIDMRSVVVLDLPAGGEYNTKLTNHLKSEDFFGSEKYPTAHFSITSVVPKGDRVMVNGDLKIKEKTNPVSFLATLKMEGGKLHLKSESFKIDRSKWDIKYKSKSFFSDLADNFIYDEVEIMIDVQASR